MTMTPNQRLLNAFDRSSFNYLTFPIKIYGKRATIAYLGLTLDEGFSDVSQGGETQVIQRKAYKRARWYGDSGGADVERATVTRFVYPSKKGGALPGRPFQFVALTDTAGDPLDRKVTGTLSIVGNWGAFVSYMKNNRPPHSVRLKSPNGAWLEAPLLSEEDQEPAGPIV